MKRAVLYARVSGDDSKYATSGIESQLDDCRKYAQERSYQIVGEYSESPEKHTSGADWLPELDNIMKLAHQRGFDVLVVREIDRLARNRFKQMSVELDLQSLDIKVDYVKGQYEDTAEGQLLKGLMGEFAEYERKKIRERTRTGKLRSVAAGNVTIGGSYAPYGYDLVKKNGRRVLKINEEEANVIYVIFDLFVNHFYTLHRLADYLDSHSIPKPMKGKNHHKRANKKNVKGWSIGTLNGILKNETYVGRWYYRKTKNVKNPKTGKVRNVPRPRKEWILVDVPAILDEDLFQAAQVRMKANKRQQGRHRIHFYTLSGLMKCGHCGNNMSGITKIYKGKPYGYYKCNAHHSPKRYGFKCDNAQYKIGEVEEAIWQWVKSILLDPDNLSQALSIYQEEQESSAQPILNMIASNNNRLESLLEEKQRLITAYREGVLTLDEISQEKSVIEKLITDLKQAIVDLENEIKPQILSEEELTSIESYVSQIREATDFTDNDRKTQRELFLLLNLQVELAIVNGEKWAEITCILGKKQFPTDYTTTWSTAKKKGK